jgi:selenocysteine-specific elongation factor
LICYPDLPGIEIKALCRELALSEPDTRAVLLELLNQGALIVDRAWARRPNHSIEFADDETHIWCEIRSLLAGQPYRPPRVRDISHLTAVAEDVVRSLLRRAALRGYVEEIAHDHYFLRSVVQTMVDIAIELASKSPEGFSAANFRDRLGNGRKVAIQILEYFDKHGLTTRHDDLRRVEAVKRVHSRDA